MRALIWAFLLCNFCLAQLVTVRVINSKTGQGLPKQPIAVQFLAESPPAASAIVNIETNGNGEAQFSIPGPAPRHLNVRATLTSEYWYCVCWVMTDTDKVLQMGIVQTAPGSKAISVNRAEPKPREVLFFARPFTFFERLMYPLAKE